MPVKLVYWDVRGLGEPIRHILRYHGDSWENIILPPTAQGFARYMPMRDSPDLPFGNLPFIEDGNVKVSQSITVMRYLGRKFDLYPTTGEDVLLCEVVEQEIFDLRNRLSSTCYDRYSRMGPLPGSDKGVFDHEYLKGILIRRLSERLPKFEDLLSSKPHFLIGEKPVYVDFLLYEYLDQLNLFVPASFDGMSGIKSYLERFRELPGLREWFSSEEYKSGQFVNAPHAVWNGKQ